MGLCPRLTLVSERVGSGTPNSAGDLEFSRLLVFSACFGPPLEGKTFLPWRSAAVWEVGFGTGPRKGLACTLIQFEGCTNPE